MSDAQKLKDCIAEYRKTHKVFDEKLKEAEERTHQTRQEQRDKQSRPN